MSPSYVSSSSSRSLLVQLGPALLVVFLCFASTLQTAEGVQCYVCSWSPADSGRADVCTRSNFTESVRTHTCDTGCEMVTVFDKNGKLDFFYRNCAGNTTHISGTCVNETSKAITKEVCTCNTNYCNHSGSLQPQHFFVTTALLSVVLAALLSHF